MRFVKSAWVTSPIVLIVFIGLWAGYVRAFDVSPLVLPGPGAVGEAFVDLARTQETWRHVWVTTYEIVLGFAFAVVTGVGLGTVLAKVPTLERMLNPFIVAMQVTPKTPLVPLFIVWFGFGGTSKVIIASLFAFFPIFRNTVLGIKATPTGLRDVATITQLPAIKRFRKLEFPYSAPYILTGMEVGIVMAVIGAIVGEFLSGNEGLGYLTVSYLNAFQVPNLFGVIVMLTLLGFVFHFAIMVLRRLVIPWHESETVDAP